MGKRAIYFFYLFLIITACKDREIVPQQLSNQLKAQFSVSNDSCLAPCSVEFINTSLYSDSSTWNFGDGTSISSNENLSHVYQKAGLYDVRLTVFNSSGSEDDTTAVVTIFEPDSIPAIKASFFRLDGEEDGIFPDTICFINTSINATSFFWDFGDGNTSESELDTVCHIFTDPGIFEVSLIAENEELLDTITNPIIILGNSTLISTITVENDSCIFPCEIRFTSSVDGGQQYQWNFGNGDTIVTNKKSINYDYETHGSYDVSVQVDSFNKFYIGNTRVTVKEPLPIANFKAINDSCIAPCEIFFQNTSQFPDFTIWEFGDGENTGEFEPTFTYSTAGVYEVTLIVSNTSGTDTITKVVTVLNPPSPCDSRPLFDLPQQTDLYATPINLDFTPRLQDSTYRYIWNFGDGNQSEEMIAKHSYAAVENTTEIDINLTIVKDSIRCDQSKIIKLYNGPVPGRIILTFIDQSRSVRHTSPVSFQRDSSIFAALLYQQLGEILDIAIDYDGRKLYTLIAEGKEPLNGGKNPQIWESNLNTTLARKVYSTDNQGLIPSSGRIMNIEYDPIRREVVFIEKSLITPNQFVVKGVDPISLASTTYFTFLEQNQNAINQFALNPSPRQVYYYLSREGLPSYIKRIAFSQNNLNTVVDTFQVIPPTVTYSGLAINSESQLLFYIDNTTQNIKIHDLITGNINTINKGNPNIVDRIVFDRINEQYFWIEVVPETNELRRVDINGENNIKFFPIFVNRSALSIGVFK